MNRARAYAVHVYTASGVVLAFFAAAEICSAGPDPRWVFLLFAGTVLLDYPRAPARLVWLSLLYPALYTALSVHLGWRRPGSTPDH